MRERLTRFGRTTFSSLGQRNYRLYFIGQGISLCGSWMQIVGQSWLVLKLTGSGTALGLITALQFLPVLLLGPYGGVLADRVSKRRMLFYTQAALAVLALVLATLVLTDTVRLWMVFVLAPLLGLVNALDNPVRQSFIHELVGADRIRNAVTLNSMEVNLSRVIGPAVAGLLIAGVGLGWCFLLNGLSFGAVLACLLLMVPDELHRVAPVEAKKGQLTEGLAYAMRSPVIRDVLVMMALVGTLSYEFQVTLPLLARFVFHGDAGSYALLTSAMGVGAVLGGLATAALKTDPVRTLTAGGFLFGGAILAVALAPSLPFAVAGMVLVGVFSIGFTALTNSILQVRSAPEMRGRVMALWSVSFMGSTLLGAPVVGWVSQVLDPRWALGLGALASFAAGAIGVAAVRRARLSAGATAAPEPAAAGALAAPEPAAAGASDVAPAPAAAAVGCAAERP
jgi:MFS family permease